jgi:hypothetical protein
MILGTSRAELSNLPATPMREAALRNPAEVVTGGEDGRSLVRNYRRLSKHQDPSPGPAPNRGRWLVEAKQRLVVDGSGGPVHGGDGVGSGR